MDEIALSFFMLVALNGLAVGALWIEAKGGAHRFIRYALVAQTLILLWQIINIQLSFSYSALSYYLSTVALTFSGLFFLAASLNKPDYPASLFMKVGGIFCGLLAADQGLGLGLSTEIGYLITAVFLITPVASFLGIPGSMGLIIATLQAVAAITLIASLMLLANNNESIGGLLYLLYGFIAPLISIFFVLLSVNYSRQEIAKKERTYRLFFDAIEDVFFETNPDSVLISISPSIKNFGISEENILGQQLGSFLDDSTRFYELCATAKANGEAFCYMGKLHTPKGPMDCEINVTPRSCSEDKKTQFSGTIRDITERLSLERQFIDAQRHESLGKLAGNIAHDFNNILQGIMGHSQLLEDPGLSEQSRKASLEAITSGSATAGALCRQLLLYTGSNTVSAMSNLDLRDVITETVEIIRPSLNPDCIVNIVSSTDPVAVYGDRSQLGQIIMNLIKNANEAIMVGGRIDVRLEKETVKEQLVLNSQILGSIYPGDYAKLTVKDDGIGIAPENIKKIFDPFFSTKVSGHGLGLSAIIGILKAHLGSVTVESEPGSGTCFTIWLPVAAVSLPVKTADKPNHDAALHILLVDDEKDLLSIGRSMLERMGHSVITAESGEQALNEFTATQRTFDLIVSDVKMPGIDGIALVRNLLHKKPDLPVVLASGYADASSALDRNELERIEFLGKPYRLAQLGAAIDSARQKASLAELNDA